MGLVYFSIMLTEREGCYWVKGANRRYVQRRMRGAQTRQHEVINLLVTAWKGKECLVPFVKRNAFFLLCMRHLLFLLETSGIFCKFNSFLFIYLFIFLNSILNFLIYLFVPYTTSTGERGFKITYSCKISAVELDKRGFQI